MHRNVMYMAAAILSTTLAAAVPADTALTLPALFSDHAVLQRDVAIPVWGWTEPQEEVVVSIEGHKRRTKADDSGNWRVELPPMPAGGPYTLRIDAGAESRTIEDVYTGEVWICSGQSNMQMTVRDCGGIEGGAAIANQDKIRLFRVHSKSVPEPSRECRGQWRLATSDTVDAFYAAAYYFAYDIHQALNVPVGVINNSWGGSSMEAWVSRDTLMNAPSLQGVRDSLSSIEQHFLIGKSLPRRGSDDLPLNLSSEGAGSAARLIGLWGIQAEKASYPISIVFTMKEGALRIVSASAHFGRFGSGFAESDDVRVSGDDLEWRVTFTKGGSEPVSFVGDVQVAGETFKGTLELGQHRVACLGKKLEGETAMAYWAETLENEMLTPQRRPAALYNCMLHPLVPYAFRAAIWHQGESNSSGRKAAQFGALFEAMIADWREAWNKRDFPFIFAQLQNMGPRHEGPPAERSTLAEVREAQMRCLSIPNTAMVVCVDIGEEDVHFSNKRALGRRYALAALAKVYGEPVTYSGPIFRDMEMENGRARLFFDFAEGGLQTSDGTEPEGFAIAGEDRRFVWANAAVEGSEVVVWAENVVNPVAVRFAWANNPKCNLVNAAGLPAAPFRTDEW